MQNIFVVLGMHRSGTSSVAGVLTKLGCTAPKNLLPPSPFNMRGYFESEAFMHFHDDLLASGGSSWKDWRKFDPSWYETSVACAFKARARRVFAEEFEFSSSPVLKDPRMCRLMPFWLDTFKSLNRIPRFIMPIRSPIDVADSLKRRDGTPVSESLLLWLRHALDAEFYTRGEKRSIFCWKQFVADWKTTVQRMSRDLSVEWPCFSDLPLDEIDDFVEGSLVHHDTDRANLSNKADLQSWAMRAYEALLHLAEGSQREAIWLRQLDEIRCLLDQSTELFGQTLANYQADLEAAQRELEKLRHERDELLKPFGLTKRRLSDLRVHTFEKGVSLKTHTLSVLANFA